MHGNAMMFQCLPRLRLLKKSSNPRKKNWRCRGSALRVWNKLSKAQPARGILLHAVGHHQDAPWSMMVSHMDPYWQVATLG